MQTSRGGVLGQELSYYFRQTEMLFALSLIPSENLFSFSRRCDRPGGGAASTAGRLLGGHMDQT